MLEISVVKVLSFRKKCALEKLPTGPGKIKIKRILVNSKVGYSGVMSSGRLQLDLLSMSVRWP